MTVNAKKTFRLIDIENSWLNLNVGANGYKSYRKLITEEEVQAARQGGVGTKGALYLPNPRQKLFRCAIRCPSFTSDPVDGCSK